MNDDLKNIEEAFDTNMSPQDYAIKVSCELVPDTSRLVEVSSMFFSPEELDEAGIPSESRFVLAYSPSGYSQLAAMGFDHEEIVQQYAD